MTHEEGNPVGTTAPKQQDKELILLCISTHVDGFH